MQIQNSSILKNDVSKFIFRDLVLLNKDNLNYSWKNTTGVVHMIFFKLTKCKKIQKIKETFQID